MVAVILMTRYAVLSGVRPCWEGQIGDEDRIMKRFVAVGVIVIIMVVFIAVASASLHR